MDEKAGVEVTIGVSVAKAMVCRPLEAVVLVGSEVMIMMMSSTR